jgi:hypothetical protein
MFWSKVLMRLKRGKIRRVFAQRRDELRQIFAERLRAKEAGGGRVWEDVDWLTEPVLCVAPDCREPHLALVGVVARYNEAGNGLERRTVQTETGTAVFEYEAGRWTTEGRLLPRVTPAEALRDFSEWEMARRDNSFKPN